MSRADAARLLGCSETHVRRLEAAELLHPRREVVRGRPRVRLDRAEVLRLAESDRAPEPAARRERRGERWTREDGETARDVFRMLRDRRDLRDIVIDLGVPPEVVRRLRAEYEVSFEEDDRRRDADRRRREDRAERREHAREAARRDREDREAAERRRRRRLERLGRGGERDARDAEGGAREEVEEAAAHVEDDRLPPPGRPRRGEGGEDPARRRPAG